MTRQNESVQPLQGVVVHGFAVGEFVVYPPHGVAKIVRKDNKEVGGVVCELFVLEFPHDRMTLSVPLARASKNMRAVATCEEFDQALLLLSTPYRKSKKAWTKRAPKFQEKLIQGDLISLCEILRELFRTGDAAEASFSERQFFEQAMERVVREMVVALGLTPQEAQERIECALLGAKDVPPTLGVIIEESVLEEA